jgi:lipoate synthase
MLVDTASGVILGYTDVYGKQRDVRPQVYEAIASSRVAVLTIGEYLRMTREDSEREKERKCVMTATEWFKTIDSDALDRFLLSCNAGRDPKITEFLTK